MGAADMWMDWTSLWYDAIHSDGARFLMIYVAVLVVYHWIALMELPGGWTKVVNISRVPEIIWNSS